MDSETPDQPEATEAPAATAAVSAAGFTLPPNDFSDRLSPMLVKELRQGLRTKAFTSSFILLQFLLLFSTVIASATPKTGGVLQVAFFLCLGLTLLLIQPLRGVNALNTEARLNTLELILLTRLDAFRIVAGKWASIVGESVLITIAVLPYIVLRYFFGGVNVLNDLIMLLCGLFFSAVLTALAVGFSAFRAVLLRGLMFVAAGITSLIFVGSLIEDISRSGRTSFGAGVLDLEAALMLVAILFAGVYFIYYLLDMGAARIAPISDNHSTRKRLLALIAAIAVLALTAAGVEEEFSLGVGLAILLVACIDALTERPATTAGVFQGRLWRFLPGFTRTVLAPGWHTGVLFTLLAGAVIAGFLGLVRYNSGDVEPYGWLVITMAMVIYPVLITQLFIRQTDQFMNSYVVIQCLCTIIATILGTAANTANVEWVLWMGCFIPHVSYAIALDSNASVGPVAVLCGAIIVVTTIVAVGRAMPLFRESTVSYRRSRESSPRKKEVKDTRPAESA